MATSQTETAKKFDALYNDILAVDGLVIAAHLIADHNAALFNNSRENTAITGLLNTLTGMTKRCARIAAELHDDLEEPFEQGDKEASAA